MNNSLTQADAVVRIKGEGKAKRSANTRDYKAEIRQQRPDNIVEGGEMLLFVKKVARNKKIRF
jgi:hypothetical protein